MLSTNIVLFLFLSFFFIEKTSTRYSPRSRSIDIPYLFTGITLCNGSRIPDVKVELWTKKGVFKIYSLISKNSTDKYGVFTLKTLVEHKLQKDLMLYFYYYCDLKKQSHKSKKKYSKSVSSLKCPWEGSIGGIKCELKAELQDNTVGTVHYPSVSLLHNKTKEKYEIKKWDINNNISFFISNDFDNSSRVYERIINVTKEIENNTCIIFQQQNDTITDTHGINFEKSNECKNMRIGAMNENVSQSIYLTEECATSTRTIRSLLHQALGQLASVFRKDRNKYVKINFLYMNLSRVDSFNYNYRIKNNYSEEFDFGSITLSNSSAFSVDKSKKIIKPIVSYDNYYDNMMGRIEEPSFYDYKFLNNYYCMDKCQNKTNCSYPCYQDPKNCSSCVCPTGYELRTNQIFIYMAIKNNITYCLYYIYTQGSEGHVFIRFPDFRGMFLSKQCSWNNSIEIRYKKNVDYPGICLCYNKDIKAPELVSEGRHMVVIFNFQIHRSYVHLEFMEVSSSDFKYESLGEYDRIPQLLKKECNKKTKNTNDNCE
uniref:ZnMc domain-containing protein n=1 Tax=Parastrongyloides trichosuri TaxID=131310 RepID=A0A0N4Z898_PARTI